jgi:uncharacterized membrane protein
VIFIRTLALVGFGVSAYLVWMKLTGQITSVVGCGGEGGCSNVLGSQWSQWFLIPVSAVSACFYLGVIVLTYKLSKSILTIAAFLLIMAAAWFMGLQVFVIKSFCPWCFTTHSIGILTAGVIFWKARAPFKARFFFAPLLLMSVLILGQIYGPKPKTYAFTAEAGIEKREEVKAHNEGKGRVVTFKDPAGRVVKTYRLGSVPLLGSPDAKYFLVKYFDYTCQSCRTMEEDLTALMQTYPGQVAVIVLPTPLNRACNPYLNSKIHDHENACELARLGLAVWRAQPESFEDAHEILFQRPPHSEVSARAELQEIIAAEKLEAALKDPWIENVIKSNLEDYRALSSKRIEMPKLMIRGNKTMHGLSSSTEKFLKMIAKEFQLR